MVKLLGGFDTTDPSDELTYDEFDAALILEYLQWKERNIEGDDPGPPWSANEDEFKFAHDNPRAWELLPNKLPMGHDHETALAVFELYAVRANPYHDTTNGQFAAARGMGKATAVPAHEADSKVDDLQKRDPEKYWTVSKTHGDGDVFRFGSEMDPDGYVAYYHHDNGDVEIGTLFAMPGRKGAVKAAVSLADEKYPGKDQVLDAFDKVAPAYAKVGFKETGRVKFDPAYAPETWKEEYGKPDVVFMHKTSSETRKLPLSKVERSAVPDSQPCKQCAANKDPKKIPVHPGCQCTIRTDSIERAEVSSEDIRDLVNSLSDTESVEIRPDTELPETLEILPDTVVAFGEDFRFGDLLEYVSEHEDLLNNANSALALVIDDQDVTEETEEGISTIVLIHDLTATPDPERPQWTPRRKK